MGEQARVGSLLGGIRRGLGKGLALLGAGAVMSSAAMALARYQALRVSKL